MKTTELRVLRTTSMVFRSSSVSRPLTFAAGAWAAAAGASTAAGGPDGALPSPPAGRGSLGPVSAQANRAKLRARAAGTRARFRDVDMGVAPVVPL